MYRSVHKRDDDMTNYIFVCMYIVHFVLVFNRNGPAVSAVVISETIGKESPPCARLSSSIYIFFFFVVVVNIDYDDMINMTKIKLAPSRNFRWCAIETHDASKRTTHIYYLLYSLHIMRSGRGFHLTRLRPDQ